MKKLTFFERQILESISKGNSTVSSLTQDTGLEHRICIDALNLFTSENIIKSKDGLFSIVEETVRKQQSIMLPHKNINEIKNLVNLCIESELQNESDKQSFHLKKVSLNKQEKAIFNSMIYNLESFLNQIPKSKNKTEETEVVFFGNQSYKDLNQSLLNTYQ